MTPLSACMRVFDWLDDLLHIPTRTDVLHFLPSAESSAPHPRHRSPADGGAALLPGAGRNEPDQPLVAGDRPGRLPHPAADIPAVFPSAAGHGQRTCGATSSGRNPGNRPADCVTGTTQQKHPDAA